MKTVFLFIYDIFYGFCYFLGMNFLIFVAMFVLCMVPLALVMLIIQGFLSLTGQV